MYRACRVPRRRLRHLASIVNEEFPGAEWKKLRDAATATRAVKENLSTLDDAAFGAASQIMPKFISLSDPAAQWTGAMRGPAFFAYADNYLIDVKYGVIVDVEASRAMRSSPASPADRPGATESLFAKILNRLLQQNLPFSDVSRRSGWDPVPASDLRVLWLPEG